MVRWMSAAARSQPPRFFALVCNHLDGHPAFGIRSLDSRRWAQNDNNGALIRA